MERQQQFDFQKNGIEVMNFETLQRTYKENDIYNNPVQGIYHYQVIRRMMDICEKYNLDYAEEAICPIICEGDVIGGVILLNTADKEKMGEVELKLIQSAAGFLGRQMEQ